MRKGIDFPVLDHCEHKILLNHFSAYGIYCFLFYLFSYWQFILRRFQYLSSDIQRWMTG